MLVTAEHGGATYLKKKSIKQSVGGAGANYNNESEDKSQDFYGTPRSAMDEKLKIAEEKLMSLRNQSSAGGSRRTSNAAQQ